jgi:5-methylcytosine-specific restriction endonuclease McrBC regulatory subunit McrC
VNSQKREEKQREKARKMEILRLEVHDRYLGFVPIVNCSLTIAVVPRFWLKGYGSQKVDDLTGLIILPDNGSTDILFDGTSSRIEKIRNEIRSVRTSGQQLWISSRIVSSGIANNQLSPDKANELALALALMLWRDWPNEMNSRMLGLGLEKNTHHLLLGHSLVSQVNNRMFELRRTYTSNRVQGPTIKGRLNITESIPLLAVGLPEVVCDVDEFDIQSLHYSALMTTLEEVARLSSSINSDQSDAVLQFRKSVSERARTCRAKFREIPSIPISKAYSILMTEQLPAQLRNWRDIFEQACALLKRDQGTFTPARLKTQPPIERQGEKIWEMVLFRAFSKEIRFNTQSEPSMMNPWQKTNGEIILATKKPDLSIMIDQELHLLDAKYYNNPSKVLASNEWQMMGYALLPLSEQPKLFPKSVSMLVPIYPSEDEDSTIVAEKIESRTLYSPLSVENESEIRIKTQDGNMIEDADFKIYDSNGNLVSNSELIVEFADGRRIIRIESENQLQKTVEKQKSPPYLHIFTLPFPSPKHIFSQNQEEKWQESIVDSITKKIKQGVEASG